MKYSTEVRGCDKEYLSCTSYNTCSDEDGCCNPYINAEEAYAEYEDGIKMEHAEEKDLEDEGMMTHTTNVKCMRMSRVVLLILISWKMNGNR